MDFVIKGPEGKKVLVCGEEVAVNIDRLSKQPRVPREHIDLLETYSGKRPIEFVGVSDNAFLFRIRTRRKCSELDPIIGLEESDVYVAVQAKAA